MDRNVPKGKLVFATNNRHKLHEIAHILGDQFELLTLADIGCYSDIPEEEDSLEGNARQKAMYVYLNYGLDCFADDTGLEIDALNGEPGVYSARYAGENRNFDDNMNLVLEKMNLIENRSARFRTVIALVEKGRLKTFEGIIEGYITDRKMGSGGFGYDPVFQPKGYDKTFAEMSLDEKNRISHRALAVKAFAGYLNNNLI